MVHFDGGCWLCGVAGPVEATHFEGQKHMKKMASLEELGVPAAIVYAITEQAAYAAAGIQGMAPQPGQQGKKAKKGANAVQPQQAQQGKTAKKGATAKAKAAKREQVPKGDPDDPTCWSFKQGKCRKGDACKWSHE